MGVRKKSNNHTGQEALNRHHSNQSGGASRLNQEPSNKEKVWQVVSMIPAGKVATYGQVARLAGIPTHARFVGSVLGQLPARSKLPWHRVLNASFKISDRGGDDVRRQRSKLKQEVVLFIGQRVAKLHHWDT